MVNDGLIKRFGIEEVYGMHNYPGLPVGQFAIRPGPMMAADHLAIEIEGKGGHAARPHLAIDTILVGAQMINQLQSIVARNIDPLESAVVSICMFQAGQTDNVIPQHAILRGTARSLGGSPRGFAKANRRGRRAIRGGAGLGCTSFSCVVVKQPGRGPEHVVGVPEVSVEVGSSAFRRAGEQCPRVGEGHQDVSDVDDPAVRCQRLRRPGQRCWPPAARSARYRGTGGRPPR